MLKTIISLALLFSSIASAQSNIDPLFNFTRVSQIALSSNSNQIAYVTLHVDLKQTNKQWRSSLYLGEKV